jgi:hypothetical protein
VLKKRKSLDGVTQEQHNSIVKEGGYSTSAQELYDQLDSILSAVKLIAPLSVHSKAAQLSDALADASDCTLSTWDAVKFKNSIDLAMKNGAELAALMREDLSLAPE